MCVRVKRQSLRGSLPVLYLEKGATFYNGSLHLRTRQAIDPTFLTCAAIKLMAILDILEFPDSRLRTIAKPVAVVDDEVRQLVDDMFETMYEAPGIGLAATQVNVHKRIVVMDLSEDRSEPRVFINPEFETLTDEMEQYQEGCLSVPGFYENVDRPQKVKIKALDRDGQPYELIAEGLLAVCIQHECDHLNGKLFVDYLSSLKRDRIKKKLEKLHRQNA
ncbi:Peptide deformylase [Pseudomonas sp. URMO17WK12:I11]|nr:Peptide deformylase [Pseudomonas sp. URMO17WK12:I11]